MSWFISRVKINTVDGQAADLHKLYNDRHKYCMQYVVGFCLTDVQFMFCLNYWALQPSKKLILSRIFLQKRIDFDLLITMSNQNGKELAVPKKYHYCSKMFTMLFIKKLAHEYPNDFLEWLITFLFVVDLTNIWLTHLHPHPIRQKNGNYFDHFDTLCLLSISANTYYIWLSVKKLKSNMKINVYI
jgi:hypothetical protein